MSENNQPPLISVIVPARNCPDQLRRSLRSLQNSDFQDFELIVVDDASQDLTPQVANELGAQVVQLAHQSGPAKARNRGSEVARGQILLFIDADVCVHPTTLAQFARLFQEDATVAAAFGSYDDRPKAGNLVSQYRNLLHHFVHQQGCKEASTFWTGCGAVRRDAFRDVGGFDVHYTRPCIEDIELGIRLRKAGFRIVLNRDIQVTHLKHWTFWGMLKADIFDRAIPWTNLILSERDCPNDLNVNHSQRVCVVLMGILSILFLVASILAPVVLLLPVGAVLFIAAVDHWSINRRIPTLLRLLTVTTVLVVGWQIAAKFEYWSAVPSILVAAIFLMNLPFYLFVARVRGPLFACVSLPLQLLFYLYCGGAFAWGLVNHFARRVLRSYATHFASHRDAKCVAPCKR